MPRSQAASAPEASTRDHIVEVADALFYQRGFDRTSFADIAEQVQISRGNFYYHFKSKDDILAAVIERRAAGTQAMLDEWTGQEESPLGRLRCFAQMLVRNRKDIQRHGCPVGSLCTELAKLEHPSQEPAGMIFGQFRDWLRQQFAALGCGKEADALALHLLSRSQGVAALANAFRDERFIRREVALIEDWLASLAPAH
jgi:TetR/AcrR family transcriptional regulator, transcriptional repressor for nem operon